MSHRTLYPRVIIYMHTNKEPRQMEPNEVVVARLKALRVGLDGMPTPDKKYQVANIPLAVTCTTFLITNHIILTPHSSRLNR